MWNIVLLIRPAHLPINLRGAQYGHNQASDVTPPLFCNIGSMDPIGEAT